MNRKVTVVGGAGNVGATVARAIADKELADVVIVDIADQKAAGRRARHPRGLSDRRIGQRASIGGRRLRATAPTRTSSSSRRACRASRA